MLAGKARVPARENQSESVLHPFAEYRDATGRLPSVWAHRAWKVFLHTGATIRSAIGYVEQNPIKDGLKPQRWNIVTPF